MVTDSYDVKKWIHFAQMDLDSAFALAERFRPPLEIVCYHCQQATEKVLKAYIIANTNAPPQKTHELKDLLNVCVQYCADFDKFRAVCSNLTSYIFLTRYPSTIDLTEYAMKQALKDAQAVLEFTIPKLAEMGIEAP
jgi:HEPN domain-containing protein